MVIGVRTISLHLPGCRSLKEKRFILKSLKDKLRTKFNVSVAEIDYQDLWQRTTIAIVAVNNSSAYVDGLLDKMIQIIEKERKAVILEVNAQTL